MPGRAVWPESTHISRLIKIEGIPSKYLAHKVDKQKIVAVMLRRLPKEVRPRIEAGERARYVQADFNRKALSQLYGVDFSESSTVDIIDQVQHSLFPNITIWSTPIAPLCYRYRPYNDSPDEVLYEM